MMPMITMKRVIFLYIPLIILAILLLTGTSLGFGTAPASCLVRVDQIGYLSGHDKIAVLVLDKNELPAKYFYVKDYSSNKALFQGQIMDNPVFDEDSEDFAVQLDFSSLSEPGRYFIETGNGRRSYSFDIGAGIYESLFYDVARGFYYQRCGMALDNKHAGKWERPVCHEDDAIILESGKHKRSVGGWHDAGDFGKKVVPGAVSAALLMKIFEMFPGKLSDVALNIPNPGSLPDILSEVKYELDWMLTMQREDGGVHHLIATKVFPPLDTMPHNDRAPRYIVHVSSAATGGFAAAMAMAARVYSSYDPKFASSALSAAEKAWDFLEKNRNIVPEGGYRDPEGFMGTGAYEDKEDRDERFWAAVELFRTTGKEKYHDHIKANYKLWAPAVSYPFSWLDVHLLGMFGYITLDDKIADKKIKASIIKDLTLFAEQVVDRIGRSPYRVALTSSDYYWGSNGVALNYGIVLLIANEVDPNPKYIEGALDQLHYVLGRNPLNLCFVTGAGSLSPKNPLHIPSIADGIGQPIPGFLVGGPNAKAEDKVAADHIRKYNLPPAKSYIDHRHSYSTNEISIYWNAILAFMLGYFL